MAKPTSKQTAVPAERSLLTLLTDRVLAIPRLARLVLVVLAAVAATLLVTPTIDGLYLRYVFPWQADEVADIVRLIPTLISTTVGLLLFALGWWLLVGPAGTTPRRRLPALAMFLLVVILIGIAVVQVVVGLVGVSQL